MDSSSSPSPALPAPQHIAIVMDGNGRWATQQNVSTIAGHRAGEKAAREVVRHAAHLGVKYLTLFTFSSENWKRPKGWVDELMGLLRFFLRHEIKELLKNNVQLRVIGDLTCLASDLQQMIAKAEEETRQNNGLILQLAISYGGRDDITRTVKRLAEQVHQGRLSPQDITESLISSSLDTNDGPDPDLLIRTSGEFRLSNFLLWQLAYTELVFVDTLFPDFTPQHLDQAIAAYRQRDRRFGARFGSHVKLEAPYQAEEQA